MFALSSGNFLKTWFKLLRNSIKDCSDVTEHSFSKVSVRQTPPPTVADWLLLLFISPDRKGAVVNIAALIYMTGSF